MDGLTQLEREAIEFLLKGDESWKVLLREQLSVLEVSSRFKDPKGDSVSFKSPNRGPSVKGQLQKNPISIDMMRHREMPEGGTIDLWINNDGYIDYMEMTSYGKELWPRDAVKLSDFEIIKS